ncbi:MAG: TonB-dependent receptor, partial [Gammaproteobacteria bacterium]|nr:TonB-dependent receptor [Gammaproteobacteria bacterium]
YTDADYKEYWVDATVLGSGEQYINRADEPMPRVAEWTGFFAIDYFFHTDSFGTISPHVDVRYTSEVYNGFDRDSWLVSENGGGMWAPETAFYGARLTWQLPDDRTTFALWGKNLSDEDDYLAGGIPLVSVTRASGVVYADPRTYGLDFSYRFGD